MANFLSKMIDRLFAVAGAFIFCQIPEVMKQYTTLLSGHLAESKLQMHMLQKNADIANKTIPEYILKFMQQQDIDFVRQGEMLQKMVDRNIDLQAAYTDMLSATIWTKPFAFLSKMELPIFNETMNQFSPGLAFTLETTIYAIIGILFGVLLYRTIARSLRAVFIPKKEAPLKSHPQ